MIQEGDIFEKGRFTQQYGIISQAELLNHILQVFKNDKFKMGVKLEVLSNFLGSTHPQYSKVPIRKYLAIIEHLKDSGIIYECNHKYYKLALEI